jgi:hypothetical protein
MELWKKRESLLVALRASSKEALRNCNQGICQSQDICGCWDMGEFGHLWRQWYLLRVLEHVLTRLPRQVNTTASADSQPVLNQLAALLE